MAPLFRSRIAIALVALSAAFVLASVALVSLNLGDLPPKLIIHFDAFRGIDFFGDHTDLWWFLGLGVGMMALNVALGFAFFYRERAITYLFLATNIVLGLLMVIVTTTILSVN